MSHDTSIALELRRKAERPSPALGNRLRERWIRVRPRTRCTVADWEEPLERFDRLHAEFRHPLGRF
jgi:hypothetical protein